MAAKKKSTSSGKGTTGSKPARTRPRAAKAGAASTISVAEVRLVLGRISAYAAYLESALAGLPANERLKVHPVGVGPQPIPNPAPLDFRCDPPRVPIPMGRRCAIIVEGGPPPPKVPMGSRCRPGLSGEDDK